MSPVYCAEKAFCGDPENSGHLLPEESNVASPVKFHLVVAETKNHFCCSLHKIELSMRFLRTTKILRGQTLLASLVQTIEKPCEQYHRYY